VRLFEPGRPTRSLLAVVSNVQWVDPDYLVFAREGTLLAQRVDLAAGQVTGEPFAIADAVNYAYMPSRAMFTTSQNGVVVYQSNRDVARLAWIDRTGKELQTIGSPAGYYQMRLSPDQRQVLIARSSSRYGTNDLWVLDLERGNESMMTSDALPDLPGPWLPGQQAFVFTAARRGAPHLFQRDLRTGKDHEILPAGAFQIPSDVTPDGKQLIFSHRAEGGTWDVSLLQLGSGTSPAPLFASQFSEFDARLSPDGHAVAFTSDESGRGELYVSPFPPTGSKVLISTGGGWSPRWSLDSRELFYLAPDRRLMVVPIRTGPRLEVGRPSPLFTLAGKSWTDYDVSSDGKKFLAVVPERLSREQPLTAILNWLAEVRR
jgi:hypothetical protein